MKKYLRRLKTGMSDTQDTIIRKIFSRFDDLQSDEIRSRAGAQVDVASAACYNVKQECHKDEIKL